MGSLYGVTLTSAFPNIGMVQKLREKKEKSHKTLRFKDE